MCSGCSGDYENDGDEAGSASTGANDELEPDIPRDGFISPGNSQVSITHGDTSSLGTPTPRNADRRRHRSAARDGGPESSYEVYVSAEQIVEVRVILPNSLPGSELGDDGPRGDWQVNLRVCGHSGVQSAKHYRTRRSSKLSVFHALCSVCSPLRDCGLEALRRAGATIRRIGGQSGRPLAGVKQITGLISNCSAERRDDAGSDRGPIV